LFSQVWVSIQFPTLPLSRIGFACEALFRWHWSSNPFPVVCVTDRPQVISFSVLFELMPRGGVVRSFTFFLQILQGTQYQLFWNLMHSCKYWSWLTTRYAPATLDSILHRPSQWCWSYLKLEWRMLTSNQDFLILFSGIPRSSFWPVLTTRCMLAGNFHSRLQGCASHSCHCGGVWNCGSSTSN
jgi:hypothetical protein